MTIQGKKVPAVCGTSGFIDQTWVDPNVGLLLLWFRSGSRLVQVTKYVGSVGSALSVIISLVVAVKIREFMAKIEASYWIYRV